MPDRYSDLHKAICNQVGLLRGPIIVRPLRSLRAGSTGLSGDALDPQLAAFNVARRLRVAGMAYLALFFVLQPLAPSCPITGVPIKYEAWYCRNGREGLFSRTRSPAMLVNKV